MSMFAALSLSASSSLPSSTTKVVHSFQMIPSMFSRRGRKRLFSHHQRASRFFSTQSEHVSIEEFRYDVPPNTNNKPKKTILVVGDGDLSYSSSIAQNCYDNNITLIASVLENRTHHEQIFTKSKEHTNTITSFQHQVLFKLDATKLHQQFFPNSCFDTIIFNFPHWPGKANNRYNRQLINDFLYSASQVLDRQGEIHIALKSEQGGVHAKDMTDWKLSWMVSEYAVQHGLLLRHVEPFEEEYNKSCYRGQDKSFHVGSQPQRFIFTFPNGQSVDRSLHLCYRHELRIKLHPENVAKSSWSADQLLKDDIVLNLAREIVPEGIHVEIPMKTRFEAMPGKHTANAPLLIYLLVYGGESIPLTRVAADNIREKLEQAIMERLGFELAKPGRLVSKPFPYSILSKLIRDYS